MAAISFRADEETRHDSLMEAIGNGLYAAAAMLWQMLWALVLGFAISAAMQVLREQGENG